MSSTRKAMKRRLLDDLLEAERRLRSARSLAGLLADRSNLFALRRGAHDEDITLNSQHLSVTIDRIALHVQVAFLLAETRDRS